MGKSSAPTGAATQKSPGSLSDRGEITLSRGRARLMFSIRRSVLTMRASPLA
jgi:hypothetical protein